jgi:hypothetical protein
VGLVYSMESKGIYVVRYMYVRVSTIEPGTCLSDHSRFFHTESQGAFLGRHRDGADLVSSSRKQKRKREKGERRMGEGNVDG